MVGFGNKFKQVQDMLANFQEAQSKVEKVVKTGEAGAGAVKVEMNGEHEALSVSIEQDIFDGDKKVAEELLAAAINDATHKVKAAIKEELASISANLGLPQDFDFKNGDK